MRSALELRLRERAGPFLRKAEPVLILLAHAWRTVLLRTTFIGVTGSLGKTTTKELLANMLQSKARTFRSYRNQNNTTAVALNILRVRPWHRFAVIEVAGAAPGMMKRSARLLRPDVAVVLNVRRTHTTEFARLELHAAEKYELVKILRPGAIAVLNGDDVLVSVMKAPEGVTTRWFGSDARFDFHAGNERSLWPGRLEFDLEHAGETQRVITRLVGAQWLGSAAAAAATAMCLGIDRNGVQRGAARTEPFTARLEPMRVASGAIFLRDDYNASIDAIEPSLRVLAEATALRMVLVITVVSDFGENRRQRLKYLGARAAQVSDVVVFVGRIAEYGARRAVEAGMKESDAHGFRNLREAAEFLKSELRDGDLVLLKGRTTDHAARLFLSQLGDIACWASHCPKRMLCDMCWELGASEETLRRALPVI
jgi:UDP-N-acetylmuramoyl-tripeptide--D-alanyl-D-alanine ligase